MEMALPGVHHQRRLMKALELLHDLSRGDFPARVIAACQHLIPETSHGFSLWHKTDGTRTGLLHAPGHAGALEARLRGLATLPRGGEAAAQPAPRSRPRGPGHQLAIPLRTETHTGGVIFLRGGGRGFDASEKRAATLLARHIPLAHAAALALAAVPAGPPPAPEQDRRAAGRMGLTGRQAEVLGWLAQGKRDKEIALILGVSHRTITGHVHAILTKLGVETRTAAAAALRGE